MGHIKPIRILHVVGAMNNGGTETMLMNIYRNVDHKSVQFDFISYSQADAHYDEEIRALGGRVIKLTKTWSIKQIYDVIRKHGQYDVVHAHTLFHCGIANIAARLANVKVIISHAHTTLDAHGSYLRRMYIGMMRMVISKFSTHLLACSHGAGKYLFGEKELTNPRYAFFANAIDYKKFLTSHSTEVKRFKVKEGLGNHMILGHIGTFKEVKNHRFLLDIMKQMKNNPSAKMLLVGDGELREQLENKSKQLNIDKNVHFLGNRKDVATIINSMDVFVFPSIYEGLGLVLLEAQASGIPCVVSEAIQPEADLGLGLITKLSLDDGPDVWANKIIELTGTRERNAHKIMSSFEEKGYSVQHGVATLMSIYRSNTGGGNEADTNFVL